MNRILIFFFVLTFSLINLAAQTHPEFENITLDRPLPTKFQAGELYNLKGTINNFRHKVRLMVDSKLIGGDFTEIISINCLDSTFSVFINFKFPGGYYLNMTLNSRNKGTRMVIVDQPDTLVAQPVQPIHDFQTTPTETGFSINWKSSNELINLEVLQNDKKQNLILSSCPQKFILNPEDFCGFSAGLANFRLRGARSNSGSYYQKSSEWGEWSEINRMLVPQLDPIKAEAVEFLRPYICIGEVDSLIVLDMKIRDNFEKNAYIRRPDGLVEKVPFAILKTKMYTVAGQVEELGVPGNCVLEYTPRLEGTYLIEINDEKGFALMNIPFYCGNALPLIPVPEVAANQDSFNLDSIRISMLREINQMRAYVGLNALRPDSTLNYVAQYYSEKMAREEYCAHVSPHGQTPFDRKRVFKVLPQMNENVARSKSPKIALDNLIHSPVHYAAMIDSLAQQAGLGIKFGSDSLFYVTQYFSPFIKTSEQLDSFLDDLFAAMKAEKKKLVRIYEKDEWPALVGRIYTAPTFEILRKMILVDSKFETWNLKAVRKVYFVEFEERIEGFTLKVQFHAKAEKIKK
jgi:hypothetical protein